MFTAMPLGINKEKAYGINAIVQFYLNGDENETVISQFGTKLVSIPLESMKNRQWL